MRIKNFKFFKTLSFYFHSLILTTTVECDMTDIEHEHHKAGANSIFLASAIKCSYRRA